MRAIAFDRLDYRSAGLVDALRRGSLVIPEPLESHIGQLVSSEMPWAKDIRGGLALELNVISLTHLVGDAVAETVTLDELHAVVDRELGPLVEMRPRSGLFERYLSEGREMPVVAKVALLELLHPTRWEEEW